MKTIKKKVWVIIDENDVEFAAYFSQGECPSSPQTDALAVYARRIDAEKDEEYGIEAHKVFPATLTYRLPKKKNKKSK